MADTLLKISDLQATTTAPDSSFIPIDDGTLTKKITVANFNATSTASALSYATASENSSLDSEAWAKGQRNGVNVGSSDPAYQNNAKYYAEQAHSDATSANSAMLAAQSAQTYAEAAQTAAEGAATQAATAAETMTGYAAQVAGYVTQAHSEADRAENAANLASGYMAVIEEDVGDVISAVQTAEGAASTATTKAQDAESWAVGTRNGTNVTPSDSQYHNNSKYYAEQAASSALDAAGSVTEAQGYASDASGYKDTAQQMQAGATLKATEAANHALDSEAWAIGKRNNVDVGNTDAAYQNNSKYYSQQASSSASDAATASANATYVMEQISTMIGAPTFTVDLTTGEVMYTMNNVFSFNINQTTGELEWEVVA